MGSSDDSDSGSSAPDEGIADNVQWGVDEGKIPPPLGLEGLDLPPPPPLEGLELPPPPPPGMDEKIVDSKKSTKTAPDLPPLDVGMIPPPPPLPDPPVAAEKEPQPEAEEEPEVPDIEIPPPPALNDDLSLAADDLLASVPLPQEPAFAIPQILADEIDIQPIPEPVEEVFEVTEVEEEVGEYRDLWKRRSEKPLQQVYGHIDRLGSGEVGTLLERYADRFGSELDRDIIVLRKREQQQKLKEMHDVPIVELVEESAAEVVEVPAQDSGLAAEVEAELESELARIEGEIDELEPMFKKAKKKRKSAQVKQFGDSLSLLFEQRDSILDVLEGEAEYDSLDLALQADDDEDFIRFTVVVDDLLGKLPEDALQSFLESDTFDLYREVAGQPEDAEDASRQSFFQLVNEKLVELPESVIDEFIASEDWGLYEEIGSRYND